MKERIPLNPDIEMIIYFYIFICISLLIFNVVCVFRPKGRNKRHIRQVQQWKARVEVALDSGVTPHHQELLLRRLSSVQQLMSYQDALTSLEEHPAMQAYLDSNHDVFQTLTETYRHRSAADRAYFAYLIACYHPRRGRERDQLAELLLDFLDDSTVYCRQNVFLALCALGNSGAVETALRWFQREEWRHNPHLLSDGLMTFFGNQETLVRQLWSRVNPKEELLQVVVVQFAAQLSEDFTSLFLEALERGDTPMESRFALIRYFQRHPAPEAKPALLRLALHPDGNGPAISACAALAKYPGADTVAVLEEALHSRSWHIRRNAAAALAELGVTIEDLPKLAQSGDRYAVEILQYMQERRKTVGV